MTGTTKEKVMPESISPRLLERAKAVRREEYGQVVGAFANVMVERLDAHSVKGEVPDWGDFSEFELDTILGDASQDVETLVDELREITGDHDVKDETIAYYTRLSADVANRLMIVLAALYQRTHRGEGGR